jgi:hypothetical protein
MSELRADGLRLPRPDRLAPYLDPSTGLSVFTAAFLADRGVCCASGCRHCPFEA